MFDQVFDAPAGHGRACSTIAGVAAQSLLLTAAVMVPLIFPEALPRVRSAVDLLAPPGPPPPPPPPLKTMLVRTSPRTLQPTRILIEPRAMPPSPVMFVDPPPAAPETGPAGVIGGTEGGSPDGVVGSVVNMFTQAVNSIRPSVLPPKLPAAPPKQAAAVAPPPKAPISVGGDVQEAKIIHRILPLYPPLARRARISGKVELHGLIGVDGRIRALRVLSGHPLLIQSALDAVRQWVYRPTLLNGSPVEVEAPITVNFTLLKN
jgi:protein TonB